MIIRPGLVSQHSFTKRIELGLLCVCLCVCVCVCVCVWSWGIFSCNNGDERVCCKGEPHGTWRNHTAHLRYKKRLLDRVAGSACWDQLKRRIKHRPGPADQWHSMLPRRPILKPTPSCIFPSTKFFCWCDFAYVCVCVFLHLLFRSWLAALHMGKRGRGGEGCPGSGGGGPSFLQRVQIFTILRNKRTWGGICWQCKNQNKNKKWAEPSQP